MQISLLYNHSMKFSMHYQTCKFKDTNEDRKFRGVSVASRALDQPWETYAKFTSP